jgi:uracil-DNA glycosylase
MTDDKDLEKQILGHLEFYRDLGVRWVRSPEKVEKPRPVRAEQRVAAAPAAPKAMPVFAAQKRIEDTIAVVTNASVNDSLDAIRMDLKDCRRCKLAPQRKNIVFGSGNPTAELMFVGEAPGADEDEQGLPFVGRAGQLLTKIIEAMEMSRNDVFICNILKCRPPGNRNPESDEIAECEQFLFRQIAVVRPKIICALGAYGAQTLLKTTEAIGKLRGRLLDYRGVKLIATYHPAYLLRNPMEKRKVWEDMQAIRKYLDSIHSAK